MQYNFCALFDKNYLYMGLTLYSSIVKFCPNFKLWILCMDDKSFEVIEKMKLKNVELIKLKTIEDEKLLTTKDSRSKAEYAWTCKSHLLLHIFQW